MKIDKEKSNPGLDAPVAPSSNVLLSSDVYDDFVISQFYSNKTIEKSQHTIDVDLSNIYIPKKIMTDSMAKVYDDIGLSDRRRSLEMCGSWLQFANDVYYTGEIDTKTKLHRASFCKDRLCPFCNYRRSVKLQMQLFKILQKLQPDYDFIFLTPTIPNIPVDELQNGLDLYADALHKFFMLKRIKKACKGYFRTVEITYNKHRKDLNLHVHILVAVKKSYFKSTDYIKQSEFLEMWRDVTGIQNITQFNVKKVDNLWKSLLEVAKYNTKSVDILSIKNNAERNKVARAYVYRLENRRFRSFGGVMKKVKTEIGFDDFNNPNFDKLSIENPNYFRIIGWFIWNYQYQPTDKNYKLTREAYYKQNPDFDIDKYKLYLNDGDLDF